MHKGIFITIEGPEGSGKSTQAALLCAALKKRGVKVLHTREPGGTSIAEAVRRVLLSPDSRVAPMTELLLYEAARAQHIAEVVRPALAAGVTVICERYTDSTLAYQGHGRGLPLRDIRELNRVATGGLRPDVTLLLDTPVEEGLRRARRLSKTICAGGRKTRGDRLEREGLSFHKKVRRGFLAVAKSDPRRVKLFPWRDGVDGVHADVLRAALKAL